MPDSQPHSPSTTPQSGFGPLSEQEALRILMQPAPPDRFAILSRRGKPLSESQVLQILQERSTDEASATSGGQAPLPVAQRAPAPVMPLEYGRPARRAPWRPTPPAPLRYQILGLAIWAVVAVAILLIMVLSV